MKWALVITEEPLKKVKKISWKDGVRAIYCILKYGIFRFN
jgi:hypothetical protein